MRIGAVLAPTGDWQAILDGARGADDAGLDAIGLWCHYHSAKPEWAHANGWALYGALAAVTSRVRLVPMVLNNLHYQPGVLAKESSMLSLISRGRFELAIGAGDWPRVVHSLGRALSRAEPARCEIGRDGRRSARAVERPARDGQRAPRPIEWRDVHASARNAASRRHRRGRLAAHRSRDHRPR